MIAGANATVWIADTIAGAFDTGTLATMASDILAGLPVVEAVVVAEAVSSGVAGPTAGAADVLAVG